MKYRFENEIYEILNSSMYMSTFSSHGSEHEILTNELGKMVIPLHCLHIQNMDSLYGGRISLCRVVDTGQLRFIPVFDIEKFFFLWAKCSR